MGQGHGVPVECEVKQSFIARNVFHHLQVLGVGYYFGFYLHDLNDVTVFGRESIHKRFLGLSIVGCNKNDGIVLMFLSFQFL